MMNKPFSQACENNKQPILAVLKRIFAKVDRVLEVGSGTGQHAVFFARHLPHLVWYPSDRAENLPGIKQWIAEAGLDNVQQPLELDVSMPLWPIEKMPAVYSANTVHIMSWPEVEAFFEKLGSCLEAGAYFCLYGPFNYDGKYSSESNAGFDQWLKARDPASGIRDFEKLDLLAKQQQLSFRENNPMPANNQLLVWKKLD
jgi:cyclopropane fatty-acyl-phospholipid synthase-like methyltransferase